MIKTRGFCANSHSTQRKKSIVFSIFTIFPSIIRDFSNHFLSNSTSTFPFEYSASFSSYNLFPLKCSCLSELSEFFSLFFVLLCFSLPALCFFVLSVSFFCHPSLPLSFLLSFSFSLAAFHSVFFHCFSFLSRLGTRFFFPLPLFRFSLFSFLNSCGTLRGKGRGRRGRGEGG